MNKEEGGFVAFGDAAVELNKVKESMKHFTEREFLETIRSMSPPPMRKFKLHASQMHMLRRFPGRVLVDKYVRRTGTVYGRLATLKTLTLAVRAAIRGL